MGDISAHKRLLSQLISSVDINIPGIGVNFMVPVLNNLHSL